MKQLISQIIMLAAVLLWAAARRRASTGGWQGRRRGRRDAPGGGGTAPQSPPQSAPQPMSADGQRGEDVVWGTRPLRHPPQPRAAEQAPWARASEASMPSARGEGRGRSTHVGSAQRGTSLSMGGSRYDGSLGNSAAGEVITARRRGDPWQRLGIIGKSRAAKRRGLRKAVLLREVLGTPRAIRGPAGRRPGTD